MQIYRESEKGRYEPPACPDCGARVDQEWLDVTTSWSLAETGERSVTPGRWACRTVGCPKGPPAARLPQRGAGGEQRT